MGFSACQDDLTAPTADPDTIEMSQARRGPSVKDVAFTLTLLHNNDGESELFPDGDGHGGISRFVRVMDDLKSEVKSACKDPGFGPGRGSSKCDVIVLSSGDNFLPGPELNASLEKGPPFYDAIALAQVGYDALAIGNHEFDFGPEILADFISSFRVTRPPFLSANLDLIGEPSLARLESRGRIAKSTIVRLKGDQVGVIGATTEKLPFISSPGNVIVEDVASAIMSEVLRLKMRGINKIILISHLQSLLEDRALIPMLRDIDIVVAGGGDELLANEDDDLIPGDEEDLDPEFPYPLIEEDADGKSIPVVTTTGNYQYVGRLVVDFDSEGEVVEVKQPISGPVPVMGDPDPFVEAQVIAPVEAYVAELKANIIGTSEVILDGDKPDIRTTETNEGNLISDALLWQAKARAAEFGAAMPDVAIQNGGGIRNDSEIPAGPISEFLTFSILPFSNFLAVVGGLSAADFQNLLENAVSRVEFVDGRFAQVAGFTFTYDSSAPAGSRIVDVIVDGIGQVVSGGAVVYGGTINVATVDFLARGGDEYPFGGAPFTIYGGVSYQLALASYIQASPGDGGLGGTITAAMYPEGGEGRIVDLK
jgi:5'-nucleotidase